MVVAEALALAAASMSTTVAASMTVLVAMLVLGTTIGARDVAPLLQRPHQEAARSSTSTSTPSRRRRPRRSTRSRAKFDPKVNPLVSKTTFVSKAQALKEQRKKFPELTKALPFNPYPDAIRIQPKKADYLDDIRGAAAAAPARRPRRQGRRQHLETRAQGRRDPLGRLPRRRDHAADRLDAPDREHDPPVDLLAATRDRGDEARRRDQLVRARAVHDRGADLRPRRLARRRDPARDRQGGRSCRRSASATRRTRTRWRSS